MIAHFFYRSDSAALHSRKNSYIGNNLDILGLRGAIAQGLTRAQHSAMDLRKSVVDAAHEAGSRRKSFQPWQQNRNTEDQALEGAASDDIGCLSDFVEAGIVVDSEVYSSQDWPQQQSGDGIQIVVQEHVDPSWDVQRLRKLSDAKRLHDQHHSAVQDQPRRGKSCMIDL